MPTGTPLNHLNATCPEPNLRLYEVAVDWGGAMINMWIDGCRSMSYPMSCKIFDLVNLRPPFEHTIGRSVRLRTKGLVFAGNPLIPGTTYIVREIRLYHLVLESKPGQVMPIVRGCDVDLIEEFPEPEEDFPEP